jgi:5-methylcytosine-specific restriction endonuclease McrBC regulatory subunit McrC
MIAKLPPSWTKFAISLKHKRREFDVTQLIGTLDVEDKARAKDVKGKKVAEGGSNAHVVQKNRPKPHKKKNQQDVKPKNTIFLRRRRRTRRKATASLVARLGILLEIAQMRSGSQIRRNQ